MTGLLMSCQLGEAPGCRPSKRGRGSLVGCSAPQLRDDSCQRERPTWAALLVSHEIPTELGKLLTGQDYGGDAKKCMDKVAELVDAKVKDAGL